MTSLVSRHKTLARVVLYSLPLVAIAVLWWIRGENRDRLVTGWDDDTDYSKIEAVEILQQYLRFDTSYPDGNEIPAAEFLARLLRDNGFDVHLERLGNRNANLWAELAGKNPAAPALVLHNHIDVEPIRRPADWQQPPFGAVIQGPFLYGRGAFDMKAVAVAQLMAVLDLARSGMVPERPVIFLATGDEERDSWLGTRRLLREHPELRERFWAVLTEGGAVEALNLDTAKYWGTEFHQKRFVDVWVCDADHQRLVDLRLELHNKMAQRRLTPAVAEFMPLYAPTRVRPETRSLFTAPDQLMDRVRTYPRDVDVTVIPPYVESMMRSQVVGFPVERGENESLLRLILHLQADDTVEEVWAELIGDALGGFTYTVVEPHSPVEPSPLDHPVFLVVDRVVEARYPEIDHGPLFLPNAATDARYFRQYGIPAYGFSPFLMLAADAMKMKGANERIPIPSYLKGVELYSEVVRSLVSGPEAPAAQTTTANASVSTSDL